MRAFVEGVLIGEEKMSPLSRAVTVFFIFWIFVYACGYYLYINYNPQAATNAEMQEQTLPDNDKDPQPAYLRGDAHGGGSMQSNILNMNTNNVHVDNPIRISNEEMTTDPFVSQDCKDSSNRLSYGVIEYKLVGVIIPSRNEDKNDILMTVKSIILNSGNYLKKIVIVDDSSLVPVHSFEEWSIPMYSGIVEVITNEHRLGVAGSKHRGAKRAADTWHAETLVFLDAHCIVGDNWLYPLVGQLNKYPRSLVYPMIDVLVKNSEGMELIKAHNVVGAFDWSLNFRWESLDDAQASHSRFPHLVSASGEDDVSLSPASPGMLGIKSSYYSEIGGFDTSLLKWGQDSIELSLRVWMCGGAVMRQPCSRVAHSYLNIHEDAVVKNGVSEAMVDTNVMEVAEHYMGSAHKETVFRARFVDRVPYKVIVNPDSRMPRSLEGVKLLRDDACQSFDWFLQEVYPGLTADAADVDAAYRAHIASNYLADALADQITQYSKSSSQVSDFALGRSKERLQKHAGSAEAQRINSIHQGREPPPKQSKEVLQKSAAEEEHNLHADNLRASLKCTDEVNKFAKSCSEMDANHATNCNNNRYYMMFGCPKTCGLCGTDGKVCFDFYEKKCPIWETEGKCESDKENMQSICRFSCKFCTREVADVREQKYEAVAAPALAIPPPPSKSDHIGIPTIAVRADPYIAQLQYSSGQLSESMFQSIKCKMDKRANGELLARMTVSPAPVLPVRVLCAIYTMEKNHETNVKATKETWAKKCTGFMAFSTKTDLSLPAIFIDHEGDESYDNMWQKSRSIWKYIGKHYMDEFDFFLIGGDDMFYVMENLMHYLSSGEIRDLKSQNKGVFLGRRFFPPQQELFNSGGAGYILDRVALKVLVDNIDTPKCFPHQRGFWEDVNVANCLRVSGNIIPHDTRDNKERERFHPFTPAQNYQYRTPLVNPDWYPKYNPFLKEGFECCSVESISFHYVPGDLMRELYAYLYHCDKKHTTPNISK